MQLGFLAVSYTHLDVYKRQTEGRRHQRFRAGGHEVVCKGHSAVFGRCAAGAFRSVSYTHLRLQKLGGIELTFSNVDNIEINKKGCDKGTALYSLCKRCV